MNLSCKHKSHGLRDLLFTGQSCSNTPTLEVRHNRLQRSNNCNFFFLPLSFPNQDQLLVVNIQLNTFLPRNYCAVFFVFLNVVFFYMNLHGLSYSILVLWFI